MAVQADAGNGKRPIRKLATGIQGLDEVLLGGLPTGRVTVVRGSHGTGKTLLGLEFLCRRAAAGQRGVFVTFEETADNVRANARSMGWDLDDLEASGHFRLVSIRVPANLVRAGDFNLRAALAIVEQKIAEIEADCFVLDAIDWVLNLFRVQADRIDHIQAFHAAFRENGLTGIITSKDNDDDADVLEYLADCVVILFRRVEKQVSTRCLRVTKFRGSGYLSNEHPFHITSDGIQLLPISGVVLDHPALKDRIASGVKGLDELLGGGFFRGSAILFAGASGTGKTTLASSFAAAASLAGQRVLFLSLEESAEGLTAAMGGCGIDLGTARQQGTLSLRAHLPEARGIDEQLIGIAASIREFKPDHVVVDPVSSVRRMGSPQAAFDFQVRLISLCRNQGITCLMTTQAAAWDAIRVVSDIDVASLVECVVALEIDWRMEGFERRLVVVKSRGSRHSAAMHPFTITSEGIVLDPRTDLSGLDQQIAKRKGVSHG